MEDSEIVKLYFERSERAISETSKKYGKYCYYIANGILSDNCDSEECVNDTFIKAWETIPPNCPVMLKTFLGKITRNLSINRLYKRSADKRGGGVVKLSLDEISECIPSLDSTQKAVEDKELTEIINRFLSELTKENRKIFVKRYWYLSSVREIADDCKISESKVKMSLHRSRNKLKEALNKEGVLL